MELTPPYPEKIKTIRRKTSKIGKFTNNLQLKRYLFETKYTGIKLIVKTTLNNARRILLCKYCTFSQVSCCFVYCGMLLQMDLYDIV